MLTSNWETTETPLLLQSLDFSDSGVTVKNDWVEDEAVLVSLDLLNHLCLLVGRAVVVNDTQSSLQSHVDSHIVLSNGVHGRGDEWGLEGNSLGDWRLEGNI